MLHGGSTDYFKNSKENASYSVAVVNFSAKGENMISIINVNVKKRANFPVEINENLLLFSGYCHGTL